LAKENTGKTGEGRKEKEGKQKFLKGITTEANS
jgi:hypothetical protein